ncbi:MULTISPECIES: DMT family transporter [Thiomicrorhabdus]|uniref:DMT family transporter n=1 Tax=Thiomicrorhabdus heinhorstiae TaxID=2748010 RepID=A0ABS0BSM4_9GAMM|nr:MULTISPECIES: DMT family transporter [Thiomicrorhabdus]MBF6056863.1 DMT family transporter [Thiomicrorhabdus heinhorstiae]
MNPSVFFAYFGVILIWTTTPLAIVWGAQADWFFAVATRTLIAAVIALPILLWLKPDIRWPSVSRWQLWFYASLPVLGGMTLMYWAGQYLNSGWIAIIFALTPIITGLLSPQLLPGYRLTKRKMLAVLLSFSGLVVIFQSNLHDFKSDEWLAVIAALLSVLIHSFGTLLVKKHAEKSSSLEFTLGALWVSVIGMLLLSQTPWISWKVPSEISDTALGAIVYAATFGSLIGFLLYYYLLKRIDAMRLALIPVITPVFALLLGHYLNNEALNMHTLIGTGLVLGGLLIFEGRLRMRNRPV